MTTTIVIVALMVIFGALLIGKMLMDMYPNSGFGAARDSAPEDRS